MICLKDRILLFLLTFAAVIQVILLFKTERLIQTVEAFEPVVIELVEEKETEESEPETEVTEEISEVIETSEISPETSEISLTETEIVPEPVVIQSVLDCCLDAETQQMIIDKCAEYNVDFAFTMAVIFRESSFRPNVVSYNGSSVGLMQINKINHGWLSEKLGITDFFDAEQNVTAGLYMLNDLFEKYEDPAKVLMAYNMGETGAKRLWNKGIYSTDYVEGILQQADIYNAEIAERMGENVLHR